MEINILKAKIHRATVTEANINYVGSITIDRTLMKEAGIVPYEKVQVVDINNGGRLETYVIPSNNSNGEICLNGAAARYVEVGDKVIIMSYCNIDQNDAINHRPTVGFVDDNNKVIEVTHYETPGEIK